MPSSPLGSTHSQTTSGMACHHLLWEAHTIERRRAWHDIATLGQHTRSITSGVAWHHRSLTEQTVGNVGRGMPASPLGSTHAKTTSGVASNHRLWAAHTVERRRERNAIKALGHHTRSNDVSCGIPSWTLDNTQSINVGRGMPS